MWVCVAFGSARETKRRGFLSGVKSATREIYGFELRLVGAAVAAQGQLRLDFGATTGAYILGAAPEVVGSLNVNADYPWLAPVRVFHDLQLQESLDILA